MPDVLINQYWCYTVNPEAEEPVMLINNHIGFDEEEGYGIMGDLFQRELLALDQYCIETNKKRIQVWINSPGGIVDDGMSIFAAIQKSTTKVDTYCVGMAASIAGVIFQAGARRVMSDYAYLMYHNPYGSDDDKGMAAITDMICKMICGRTGKSQAEIQKMMDKTSWIGADEALATGMCDKIEASGDLNKRRQVSIQDNAKNFWRESKHILNKLFQPSNNSAMPDQFPFSRIANKLGLVSQASDDAIMEQITSILNKKNESDKKAEDLEKKMEDLKKSMEDKKSEYDDMKKKHDDLKKDYDDLKKKADDEAKKSEDKKKAEDEDKAKNLIENFAKEGRIPNDTDTMAAWKVKAVADYDGIKNLLEKLPINKKGVIINTQKTGGEADQLLTSVVAMNSATIRNRLVKEASDRKS